MDAGGGGGGLIVILGIDSGRGTGSDDFEWRGIDSAQHDIIIKCWFLKQFFFLFISELLTTSAFKCFWKIVKKIISLWLMILIVWMEKRKEKYYEVVMVKKDARLSGKFD